LTLPDRDWGLISTDGIIQLMIGDSAIDDGSPSFNWLGHNDVGSLSTTGSRRISVPEPARTALDLSAGDPVCWAFETEIGFLIVARQRLRGNKYKNQGGPVTLGDDSDQYRATVPSLFFADHDEGTEIETPVPERARVTGGEERHFVARDAMLDSEPRCCYLLTRRQLNVSMSTDDDHWNDRFATRPQFLR
jgi:hypothetical protein